MLQAIFPWAYATLGERMSAACLEALATQAQKQLPHFTAQNLANMMWAFAKLSFTLDKELLQSCEAHAVSTDRAFSPEDLVRCCLLQSSSNVFAGGHMRRWASAWALPAWRRWQHRRRSSCRTSLRRTWQT